MNPPYFLGVDGGQSSTTALIGDQSGRVVGLGRGGPCNHVGASEGQAKFTGAILGCLADACKQAGLDPGSLHFNSACLGFSGGPADKQAILKDLLRAERMTVTDDASIALSGATAGEPGIIAIAGTGSIAFGRNATGATARAGGWGYVFGDEGGGFDLTRQALRAVLRHEEGWGPETILRRMLLKETGASDANDLLHRFYTTDFPRPRIAALSKLVDEAATTGDSVAVHLLKDAARELAAFAQAVRKRLFRDPGPIPVAYIGGVFRSRTLLREFRAILERDGELCVVEPRYGPAAGALIHAYRMAGVLCALSEVPKMEK